jgi:hypothetical protein
VTARAKRIAGGRNDKELRYVTRLDPEMEQWRKLAAEWLAQRKQGQHHALSFLRHFLVTYLLEQRLEKCRRNSCAGVTLRPTMY